MSVFDTENKPVVLDCGSYLTRAGFGGDRAPTSVFQTTVGRPNQLGVASGLPFDRTYVGNDAVSRRGVLNLKYPVSHGMVGNWDDMEKVWSYTFDNELRIDSQGQTVLLSEQTFNAKANRERMTQIMFETFYVRRMFVSLQAVLAMFASGRITGTIVNSGYEITHTVPVYEGYSLPHAVLNVPIGGQHITNYLARLLDDRGYNFPTKPRDNIVDKIKQALGFVTLNFETETQKARLFSSYGSSYELPDGSIVTLRDEGFRCTEPLFDPLLINFHHKGLSSILDQTLTKCEIDIRSDLYSNIVLAGGNALFRGFESRLKKDLASVMPTLAQGHRGVKFVTPNHGEHSVWLGGSILTTLSTFLPCCISQEEYDDSGPGIVHRKCF